MPEYSPDDTLTTSSILTYTCTCMGRQPIITKDEIEECYNDQGKPIGKKIHISGTASGGVAQSATRKNL